MSQMESEHPLLLPQVFNRLLNYFSVEDLKAIRLVTRVWHSEATTLLSLKIQGILLHDKIDWKKFLKLLSKSTNSLKLTNLNHVHPFHSFIFLSNFPDDPSATPYKTAILDYMHSKYRLPRRTLWDARFFSIYGHQINELKFIQFNLYGEKSLRDFRETLSSNCPNLSFLTLQFQKDPLGSSSTPTPSPSPSPLTIAGSDNIFFPSGSNTLGNLKVLSDVLTDAFPGGIFAQNNYLEKFTFATDNKCYINPHAIEEFMSLMPELEEFTYRYTGAKKQWTLVRKVDVIDVLCNVINAGHYKNLQSLDLDSDGTVLSGEDFKKISNLKYEVKLQKFACQVFIKCDLDWENFSSWLGKICEYLEKLEIQVRTHQPQLLSEQELPTSFPKVAKAKLLLDCNLKTFLKRMPNVCYFSGVYDNELFPLHGSTQALYESNEIGNNYNDSPFCPSAKYLKITGNEEFVLDIEWKSCVFPNIQSFETDIYCDQDLRLIWVHLQNIKCLILHFKTAIPEQAFTGAGLPPVTSFDDKHPEDYHDPEHLIQLEEYPHIGLMKNLKTLEIYTGSRQDAFGTQFSASIIVYGVSLLASLQRLVLPPAIPPKCMENSVRYLAKLRNLRYLSVTDDTFKSVLPFHSLKMDIPRLEIVVRYYQPEIKRVAGITWKLERLVFPDFLPDHAKKSIDKRHSTP